MPPRSPASAGRRQCFQTLGPPAPLSARGRRRPGMVPPPRLGPIRLRRSGPVGVVFVWPGALVALRGHDSTGQACSRSPRSLVCRLSLPRKQPNHTHTLRLPYMRRSTCVVPPLGLALQLARSPASLSNLACPIPLVIPPPCHSLRKASLLLCFGLRPPVGKPLSTHPRPRPFALPPVPPAPPYLARMRSL